MTFEQFRQFIEDVEARPSAWRYGQTGFNGLMSVRPDLSEQIRATTLDPFHDDARMPAFYEWVEQNW